MNTNQVVKIVKEKEKMEQVDIFWCILRRAVDGRWTEPCVAGIVWNTVVSLGVRSLSGLV